MSEPYPDPDADWPEPADEPSEQHGETLADDGTPGAAGTVPDEGVE